MKLIGDVPEHHRILAASLEDAEREADNDTLMPDELKAQICVCLAHDWFDISVEEEGSRLLAKAEAYCPGYFKHKILEHTKDDAHYSIVVQNVTSMIIQRIIGTKT